MGKGGDVEVFLGNFPSKGKKNINFPFFLEGK